MTVETRPIEVEPRTKTVGDVLRNAARIIEERGWHQGEFCGGEPLAGPVCVLGAIGMAAEGWPVPSRDSDSMVKVLNRALDGPDTAELRFPSDWNDTPGRTAAEVTAALRAAADESDR